ncbi:MAG: nitroreductase [Ahrensia sp.]|nr:nitroreductase [Ahrensia sp.]
MQPLENYMRTRRSAVSVTLEEPGPDSDEIRRIVTMATRVPDHGKLVPWRIVLWSMSQRETMHRQLLTLLDSLPDIDDKPKKRASTDKLLHAPCVMAVISTAAEHPKIPVWEQTLSAGAVCMNALIGSNACGYEAQWLTAWYVYADEARDILELQDGEKIAGIIHIGSTNTPKTERPRPQIEDILTMKDD